MSVKVNMKVISNVICNEHCSEQENYQDEDDRSKESYCDDDFLLSSSIEVCLLGLFPQQPDRPVEIAMYALDFVWRSYADGFLPHSHGYKKDLKEVEKLIYKTIKAWSSFQERVKKDTLMADTAIKEALGV